MGQYLTKAESDASELAALEGVISRGLQTFVEVGQALLDIRDKELYKLTHDTFEDYCWKRWRLKQSRAYQLMGASEVVSNLTSSKILELPSNDAQARELAPLLPAQQPAAWQRAVETAPNGKVTAAHVAKTVRSMTAGEARAVIDDGFQDDAADDVFCDDEADSRFLDEDGSPEPDEREAAESESEPAPQPVAEPSPVRATPAMAVVETGPPPRPVPPPALVSSTSTEWYTPPEYINAAREVMGGIDLDPASSPYANRTVGATRYHTADDDGLAARWAGRVWLNPPYGRDETGSSQGRWSDYLLRAYHEGAVTAAVLLVNGSALSTRWFAPLWRFPVCITNHRIRFYNEDGVGPQPAHGSALVYLGSDDDAFDRVFSRFGVVVVRRTDWSADVSRA